MVDGEFALDDGSIVSPRVDATEGTATLPFPREELSGEAVPLVIHFKIATSNKLIRLATQQAVDEALRGIRVMGHDIVAILTPEGVEMTAADVQKIAAYVTPAVKRSLGIP